MVEVRELCGKGEVLVEAYCFQGTPSYILAMKLKALKLDLKQWNETEFSNVTTRKKNL